MSSAKTPAETLEPGTMHEPSGRRVGGVETIAGGDRNGPADNARREARKKAEAEAVAAAAAEKAAPSRKK